jgi:hypothetical protein
VRRFDRLLRRSIPGGRRADTQAYHIPLAHGDSLIAMVVVLGDCTHRHRPTLHPGAGVADPSTTLRAGSVHGADAEGVGWVRIAHKWRLGLGGVRQPGGPGPTLTHFVGHVVVTQAGEEILGGQFTCEWRDCGANREVADGSLTTPAL